MNRVEVTEEFTLKDFDKLENITRFSEGTDTKGKLYVGDTFYCDNEMLDYLSGNNKLNKSFVKVLEVTEEVVEEVNEQEKEVNEIVEEKPIKNKKNKKHKK